MKKNILLFIVFALLCARVSKAQDTLLFNDFQQPHYFHGDTLNIPPGTSVDNTWYLFNANPLVNGASTYRPNHWYIAPPASYNDHYVTGLLDTSITSIITPDSNTVLAASSWSNLGDGPNALESNYCITPSIQLGPHDTLFWKSAPYQTPRYLDRYYVLISHTNNDISMFVDTIFRAAEMVGTPPVNTDTLFSDFTFSPTGANIFVHGLDGTYIDVAGTTAPISHAGQLRPFSYPLYAYANQTIFIAFLSNSHDDDQISIDDVMVRGTASAQSTTFAASFSMVPDSANPYIYWTYNTSIGSNLTYAWDFGDGGTSTLQSPIHTYLSSGSYTVCLTISSGGNNTTVCHPVYVASAANSCMALFNISHDSSSTNPNAYTITDLSYGSNLTYLWNFGDTTTSTLQHPTHSYLGAGPYQLCLTVNNGAGCVQTYCDSLYAVDSLHTHLQPISATVVDGPEPPITTEIKTVTTVSEIIISPNPLTDQTTILFSEVQRKTLIKVVNLLGEEIQESSMSGKQYILNLSDISKGIYFVQITDENKNVVNRKVLVE